MTERKTKNKVYTFDWFMLVIIVASCIGGFIDDLIIGLEFGSFAYIIISIYTTKWFFND